MANARKGDVSKGELIRDLLGPMILALDDEGLDERSLAKRLKRSLNAKRTALVKLKGDIGAQPALPRGVKVVARTDEEVLLSVSVPDGVARLGAIKETLKLLNAYPALQVQHQGSLVHHLRLDEEQLKTFEASVADFHRAIIEAHRAKLG